MSLRTLMFGWEYPPLHSGGLGVACQGLVRGLLRNGIQVTLVLPNKNAEPEDNLHVLHPTEELKRMMTTMHVPSLLQPYDTIDEYLLRANGVAHRNTKDINALYGPDLGAAVEQFTAMSVEMTKHVQADVVHCHDWMTYEAGIRAAHYHRRPLVAHIHATEFDRTDFHPNTWILDRERRGFLKADKIIAVSQYTKNLIAREYGINPDKIAVVHNGHDRGAHDCHRSGIGRRGGKHSPLVLFLGRLTIQKNPWQFLQVARSVLDFRGDVQFVMAGDGPMLTELIDRSYELGLSENMFFAGKVGKREVNALYAAADCFVMPSLSEPFGLVALEAIAHGAPVIVSKQSGVAEVIDHGFKIDFWDTEKMADCILTILREEPLAAQLRSEAPRVLHRLTWQNQAGHVRSIYNQVIRVSHK